MKTKRAFKLNCCLTAILAAIAAAPTESLAKSKNPPSRVHALEDENAELRRQVEELQTKLRESEAAAAKQIAAPVPANPFAPKEVAKTAAAAGAPSKAGGEMSCGARMAGGDMKMEPGSQFYFNPVWGGMDMFHTHPKGMWMANVKWMHSQDNGLMAGTAPVNPQNVYTGMKNGMASKYPYMMPGTGQTMDMFMFMPMYGVTDDLTLMAMINYQYMTMPMTMNMGMKMGYMTEGMAPMDSGGLGDTQVDAIYKIGQWGQHNLTGTMGLNIPTGSTSQQTYNMMGDNKPAQILSPYDMQNGQGTVNLMPALTYQWLSEDALWNLGGQASGVYHIGTKNGYSMGDSVTLSAWGQRAFGDATAWLRAKYINTAQIYGSNPNMNKYTYVGNGAWLMPDYNPQNYGGDVLNMLVGSSYQYHNYSIGLEGGIPVYQDLNGIQLRNSWYLNAGFQAMF
ncbi:MAG: hypothetical protein PHT19_08155 [Methylococcus sp.]|nr:hypothetical protein [Methylococcus sp.]